MFFGNNFMLKKYNVTVQRAFVYNLNKKQMVCNTTIFNRTFKFKIVHRRSMGS